MINRVELEREAVHWKSKLYTVIKDRRDSYSVYCSRTDNYAGLYHRNGVDSEYKPSQFYLTKEND
jgi:hypothetical protein